VIHEIIFGPITIQFVAVRFEVAVGVHVVEPID
jgi:hypothetical protein